MHPALLLLLRLRQGAFWRRTLASLKTPRGAAIMVATATFFALMVLPQLIVPILAAFSPVGAEANRQLVEAAMPIVRTLLPLALLAFVMVSVGTGWGESAIYFTPADVDFLFPGPFSRRDLLLYKLSQSVRGSLVAGTFFSLFAARYAPLLAGAWLGTVLTLLFINAVTLALTLLSQILSQRADTRWRRAVLAAVAIAVGFGLVSSVRDFDLLHAIDSLSRFRESVVGRIVLAPFEPFGRMVTAPTIAELSLWAVIALGMVLGLFALSISLDANYLETAQRVSERHYQRLQRRRQGGGAIAAVPLAGAYRIRLSRPRWLGGVGPNLWRQWLLLLRRSQGLLVLVAVALAMGVPLVFFRRQSKEEVQLYVVPIAVFAALAYQSVLASMQLPAGFRGDIDRMDWLKSLPIHPAALTLGQIVGPALLLSLVQVILLVAAWMLCGGSHVMYLIGLALLVPVNLLLFGVENLMFLVFPMRPSAATAGDFQFMGKYTLLAMFKMLLAVVGLAVASAGAIVYLLVPQLWLAVGCCLLLLLGIDLIVVLLATKAFQRFDISLDTPPA
jgi:hypothetical protein